MSASPPTDPGAPDPEMLHLDEALCFALYAASRAVTGLYRPLLGELGLTYPQYVVMLSLWERDDVTISTLSAQLHLDHGTLSPLLKRLEGLGLISRVRAREDERTVRITLTPPGSALRERALCIPAQIADATGLDAAANQQLLVTLKALAAAVGESAATQPGQ